MNVVNPTAADTVAADICKGAKQIKPQLVLTPAGKLSYRVSRQFPALYEPMMARQLQEDLIR
jgi:hypothetical protein